MSSNVPSADSFNHLIIVCCHATYAGDGSDLSASQWLLQKFQSEEHETFLAHILAGCHMLQLDAHARLVFSGGCTADESRSESLGYSKAALGLKIPDYDVLKQRTSLEQNATDSYQNLLFSLLIFRKEVGRYPEKITIITHAFKERRFLELHGPAIKFPAGRLRVQGINPPLRLAQLKEVEEGERRRGYAPFEQDLYGTRPPLSEKRKARRWSRDSIQTLRFDGMEPQVERLLYWTGEKGGNLIIDEPMPWEDKPTK